MSSARASDPNDVRRFLTALWRDGDVREIRIPRHNKYGHTASGYFENVEDALAAAQPWASRVNIYITVNPVVPALLARAKNRIDPHVASSTADVNVLRRDWLFVDIDPVRPAGISSTEAELAAAQDVLSNLTAFLHDAGWPAPITCMSGNGVYALYPIQLPNDDEAKALVTGVLETLAARF